MEKKKSPSVAFNIFCNTLAVLLVMFTAAEPSPSISFPLWFTIAAVELALAVFFYKLPKLINNSNNQ